MAAMVDYVPESKPMPTRIVSSDNLIRVGARVVTYENLTTIWLDGKALPFSDWSQESHGGHLAGFLYWLESE
jgi:hypothetical protein